VTLGATDDGVGFGFGFDVGVGVGVELGLAAGVRVVVVDDGGLDRVVVGDGLGAGAVVLAGAGGLEVGVAETTGPVGAVDCGWVPGASGVHEVPWESVGATSAGLGGELGGKVACLSRFSTFVFS
jgi:hypothetical protein